jgi:aspartyl-tRNA(Asn)/glutamyl-tRNA(Gln) amidotransferase subunit C
MAVSEDDVRHVASLARLAIDPARLSSLVSELNGILGHMEALGAVETSGWRMGDGGGATTATPMRSDIDGKSVPLVVSREAFAPKTRDGFFLVPRLETHEGEGERAP